MLEYDKSHLFGGNDHVQFPNSKYIYFTQDLCITLLMIANMIYKGILLIWLTKNELCMHMLKHCRKYIMWNKAQGVRPRC